MTKDFLCFPASATDASAVNPNKTETLLANSLYICFINGNPFFSIVLRSPPRNPLECIILDK